MTQNTSTGSSREAVDLRVRRTRKLLREAVIALSREKGFEQVTVSDITERAMVNRATFYRHYQDKYDLVETCVRELLDNLPLPQLEGKQVPLRVLVAIVTTLFAHISEHAEFYLALSGKKGWPRLIDFLGVYFDRLMQHYFQLLLRKPGQAKIPRELCITFVNTAGSATIKWWLGHDLTYPPSQVSAWFIQLVRPSLSQLLNVQDDDSYRENSNSFPH